MSMAHCLGDSYRSVRGSENAIFMDCMTISIAHNGSGVMSLLGSLPERYVQMILGIFWS